jgi:hypothetical protein
MTQVKDDLDLDSLVTFLTTRGIKASTATANAIVKAKKMTDDDWGGMLYFRQAGILAAAMQKLKTFFTHPDAAMQDCHVQDYRLHTLFEALASASCLARRCIDDDLADQLLSREVKRVSAASARSRKAEKSRRRTDIILERAKDVRFMHPQRTCWWVAGRILEDVKKQFEESKLGSISHDGVDKCLKLNWPRLSPSLPKRRRR